MLFEKFDHVAIEQPRLLDLAGVAGAVKDFHIAAGNARLQGCGARMRAVGSSRAISFSSRRSSCLALDLASDAAFRHNDGKFPRFSQRKRFCQKTRPEN